MYIVLLDNRMRYDRLYVIPEGETWTVLTKKGKIIQYAARGDAVKMAKKHPGSQVALLYGEIIND